MMPMGVGRKTQTMEKVEILYRTAIADTILPATANTPVQIRSRLRYSG
jgi:hypothetical protein